MNSAILIGSGITLLLLATLRRGGRTSNTPPRRWTRGDVTAAIESAAAVYGIPRWFAWAQAAKESGLNPNAAHNDAGESSFGLYQINLRAHGTTLAARGIGRAELLNPATNADYFGQLARGIAAEGRSRGYSGDALWYAVRLRLKGIGWDSFGSALARTTIRIFQPYVTRWKARVGG